MRRQPLETGECSGRYLPSRSICPNCRFQQTLVKEATPMTATANSKNEIKFFKSLAECEFDFYCSVKVLLDDLQVMRRQRDNLPIQPQNSR